MCIQSLCNSQPTALTVDTVPNSPFCIAPSLLASLSWDPEIPVLVIFWSPCPVVFSGSKPHFPSYPFLGRAAVHGVPAQHASAPLLKSLSVSRTVRLHHLSKKPEVSHGHSWLQPASSHPGANRVPLSLWHFPSWRVALQLWVMSYSLCATLHNLPSHFLPGSVGFSPGTRAPALKGEGATKL